MTRKRWRYATLLKRFICAFVAAGSVACSDSPSTLPDPPGPIVEPVEQAMSDALAAREEHLLGAIDARLRPRFGKPVDRRLTAPATTDFSTVRRWYERQALASAWAPLTVVERRTRRSSEHVIGFEHGDDAFVLVWFDIPNERGDKPVTVQRYGPGSSTAGGLIGDD